MSGAVLNSSTASSSARWSTNLASPNCSAIGMNSEADAIEPSSRFMRNRHSYSSGSWLREVTIG